VLELITDTTKVTEEYLNKIQGAIAR